MSLVVGCVTQEGAVLAADRGMMQYDHGQLTAQGGENNPSMVYQWKQKLFRLHPSLPVGIACTGVALGTRALTSEVGLPDLGERLAGGRSGGLNRSTYSMKEVAWRVQELVSRCWPAVLASKNVRPLARVAIVGYGAKGRIPEIWECTADENGVHEPVRASSVGFGLHVDGRVEATMRLLGGFSADLSGALSKHFDAATVDKVLRDFSWSEMNKWAGREIPLGDATQLAEFLISMSVQYERFRQGPRGICPPIDLATITVDDGFVWLKQNTIYDHYLRPMPAAEEVLA